MSVEKWLEQYGSDNNLNEYGESEPAQEQEQEQEVEQEENEPEVEAEVEESEPEAEVEAEENAVEEELPKKQTKEENAHYAEKRRQQQVEKQLQERLRQTKEYQTTQLLAEMYGVPQEELYDKLYEAKIAKEARDTNVPVEFVKEREELRKQQQTLQDQLQQLMFQQWQTRIDTEKAQLKQQFTMLSDADLDEAATYMLETLGRTDVPLQQAAFALHGARILDGLKNTAKNEALAEVSGRKKSPLPTKSGSKVESAVSLSDEERYVAKKLGLTDKDYSKWKEG